jgi:hypothetical protein
MGQFNRLGWRHALVAAPMLGLFAASASAEATFPPMHPGLWETSMVMQMNMAGQPPDNDTTPHVSYNCQDAASMAAAMKRLTGVMPGCKFDLEGGDGRYTVTTNCVNPSGQTGTITGTGTITIEGGTALHIADSTDSNIAGMQMSMSMSGDSKWVGACPSGMAPGDFGTMNNGVFTKQGNTMAAP